MVDYERECLQIGILGSIFGHAVLLGLFALTLSPGFRGEQPVVYSITLEGGKTLGGISQVPKDDKKSQIAPPKAAESKPESKVEKKEEKAEVSIPEKKEPPKPEPKKEEKKVEQKKPEPVKKAEEKKPAAPSKADLDKEYQKAMQRYLGESTDAGGKGFGAGKLGGSSFGGGEQRPPEFFAYRVILKDSIKSGWRWYDTAAPLVAEVSFSIAPDGKISKVSLLKGSGNREYDDSVVRAVYKASPVPAPPAKVYEFFKEVRMIFDPRE